MIIDKHQRPTLPLVISQGQLHHASWSMSAPEIPHLATLLRSSRSAAASRLRPGAAPGPLDGRGDESGHDRIVQETDHDARLSRMSAVELGYLDDPFASAFVNEQQPRRFPIINRGTYVRTTAIDRLVQEFLGGPLHDTKQIISLGAGSDTRFFRFHQAFPHRTWRYHEIDFASNTREKIAAIRRSAPMQSILRKDGVAGGGDVDISADGAALRSPSYFIHPLDLRSLAATEKVDERPALPGLDPALPTLLISECCLVYLSPHDADSILRYFTATLFAPAVPLALVLYEPIRPSDSFGRVMVQNLAGRGIVLQTLKRYSSLNRQRARLSVMGFGSGQEAADVNFIWEHWIDDEEKTRVGRLEMLDEVEEWRLLAEHYCIAWGWRDGDRSGDSASPDVFRGWREGLVGQQSDD